MKSITLIKQIDDIQIGHLFEHIYCAQLAEYFREHGLFAYTDYYLDGRTYYYGAVVLHLELYSNQAIEHQDLLRSISVEFDESTIAAGILQILAEKSADIDSFDQKQAIAKLQKLQAADWQTLDSNRTVDLSSPQTTDPALTLVERSGRQFGTIQQTIAIDRKYIDNDRATLLPLFAILSKAIRCNLQEDIANNSFCYSFEDYFVTTQNSYKDINKYRIDKRESRKLSSEIATTQQLIKAMKQQDFVRKLVDTFADIANSDMAAQPNQDEVADKTGIIIGLDAWKQIATQANIEHLLRHMTIEYKYGKDSQRLEEGIF